MKNHRCKHAKRQRAKALPTGRDTSDGLVIRFWYTSTGAKTKMRKHSGVSKIFVGANYDSYGSTKGDGKTLAHRLLRRNGVSQIKEHLAMES